MEGLGVEGQGRQRERCIGSGPARRSLTSPGGPVSLPSPMSREQGRDKWDKEEKGSDLMGGEQDPIGPPCRLPIWR